MVEVRDVTKRYGSLVALDHVSARFMPGEVHAVVGENGAGKSTLVGMIAGFTALSGGEIQLNGAQVEIVHQHFTLVPAFTVAENLALARVQSLWRGYDPKPVVDRALELARQLDWQIEPTARVANLPVGVQQRVEILKALSGDAEVVIFDEPTAVLSPDESRELLGVLRSLADRGKTVILIAHKLSEVMAVADRVTVLRKGKWIASAAKGEFDARQLAEWIVGDVPLVTAKALNSIQPGLSIKGLEVKGDRREEVIRGLDLEVHRGEIVGIGGVDGNGQIELAEALVGIRPSAAGTIMWVGDDLEVAYIPQDRHRDGLALTLSISDNLLVYGHLRPELRRGPLLSVNAIKAWAMKVTEAFQVKAESVQDLAGSLSGGNQQKVVVGREMAREPNLLVVMSPTRGLDIRATQYVHDQILAARSRGAAVVLFSPDLDELAALADRTYFLNRGQLQEGMDAAALLGGTA